MFVHLRSNICITVGTEHGRVSDCDDSNVSLTFHCSLGHLDKERFNWRRCNVLFMPQSLHYEHTSYPEDRSKPIQWQTPFYGNNTPTTEELTEFTLLKFKQNRTQ